MGFVDLNNGSGGPSSSGYGEVPTPLYRHLDTNGDGTGDKSAIGDYSSTPGIYYIQPGPNEIFRISRMMVLLSGKATSMKTDTYGSVPALTNGVVVRVQNDSGTIIELTDGVPLKTNGCWGRVAFDSVLYDSTSDSDSYLRVRWTFEKGGYPIRLDGSKNERLEVYLSDDMTDGGSTDAMQKQYFFAHGYIENTT